MCPRGKEKEGTFRRSTERPLDGLDYPGKTSDTLSEKILNSKFQIVHFSSIVTVGVPRTGGGVGLRDIGGVRFLSEFRNKIHRPLLSVHGDGRERICQIFFGLFYKDKCPTL